MSQRLLTSAKAAYSVSRINSIAFISDIVGDGVCDLAELEAEEGISIADKLPGDCGGKSCGAGNGREEGIRPGEDDGVDGPDEASSYVGGGRKDAVNLVRPLSETGSPSSSALCRSFAYLS